MITALELSKLSGERQDVALKWVDVLNDAMAEFDINTPQRIGMFLAQLAHESAGFTRLEEGLRYSSIDRLKTVWPKRFGNMYEPTAQQYVNNPRALASFVYAGRMGNGDESSGDGWRYRGRGLIQLTGLNNYRAAGMALGLDLVTDPDAAADPDIAARIAAWFWKSNGCNELADRGDFEGVTKRINGGTVGMADRIAKLNTINKELLA